MSFVTLGGDASTRPTYFELVAAEALLPSLKGAVLYGLGVRERKAATRRSAGDGSRWADEWGSLSWTECGKRRG